MLCLQLLDSYVSCRKAEKVPNAQTTEIANSTDPRIYMFRLVANMKLNVARILKTLLRIKNLLWPNLSDKNPDGIWNSASTRNPIDTYIPICDTVAPLMVKKYSGNTTVLYCEKLTCNTSSLAKFDLYFIKSIT